MTAERAPRRRLLKAGVICFNARHSTIPCTVRDFSEAGAKLLVPGSVSAPDTFELNIELDGIWVPCAVKWRRGEAVGVTFTGPVEVAAPTRVQALKPMVVEPRPSLRRKRP